MLSGGVPLGMVYYPVQFYSSLNKYKQREQHKLFGGIRAMNTKEKALSTINHQHPLPGQSKNQLVSKFHSQSVSQLHNQAVNQLVCFSVTQLVSQLICQLGNQRVVTFLQNFTLKLSLIKNKLKDNIILETLLEIQKNASLFEKPPPPNHPHPYKNELLLNCLIYIFLLSYYSQYVNYLVSQLVIKQTYF